MQEKNDLLDHVNKVKTLADQLVFLEVFIRDEDIIISLLESLLASYKYLIIALEVMRMKELMLDYVTTHLMHEMFKCKNNES